MLPDQPQRQGFRLGSIAGSTIWVRPSFLILVALFVFLYMDQGVPVAEALTWVPVILISVLAHELAHAATLGLFGYGASTIELGGWGGRTINARRSKPWHEIVVSAAGPAASFLLGAISFLSYLFVPAPPAFVELMFQANIAWAIFNMLPIYPLDGGLVLFNGLCHFTKAHKALGATTIFSILLAIVLGLVALYIQFFIAAIILASFAFQNWQTWKAIAAYRGELEARQRTEVETPRDTLGSGD